MVFNIPQKPNRTKHNPCNFQQQKWPKFLNGEWLFIMLKAVSKLVDGLYKTGVKTEHSGYTQLYIHVWFSLRS